MYIKNNESGSRNYFSFQDTVRGGHIRIHTHTHASTRARAARYHKPLFLFSPNKEKNLKFTWLYSLRLTKTGRTAYSYINY